VHVPEGVPPTVRTILGNAFAETGIKCLDFSGTSAREIHIMFATRLERLIVPPSATVCLVGAPAMRSVTCGGADALISQSREVHVESMAAPSELSPAFGTGRVYAEVAAEHQSRSNPRFPP
jgi:hypothetical protein